MTESPGLFSLISIDLPAQAGIRRMTPSLGTAAGPTWSVLTSFETPLRGSSG